MACGGEIFGISALDLAKIQPNFLANCAELAETVEKTFRVSRTD